MSSQVVTLLERETVAASSYGKGIDLGAFKNLETQLIVHNTGGASAGMIILQHSAVDEHQAYNSLTTARGLGATSNNFESETSFLRYVRWYVDGDLNGDAVVSIYLVAKE